MNPLAEMTTFSNHQSKTHLSRILRLLNADEEIVITRFGKPVARLIPYETSGTNRKNGSLKGVIGFDESFCDDLPEDELSAWG